MGRTFDTYVEELGSFGRYQQLRFYLICVPAVCISTFCMFAPVFWTQRVNHRCAFPQYTDETFDEQLINRYYNPYNVSIHSDHLVEQCEMFNPSCDILDSSCRSELDKNRTWKQVTCKFGHKYTGNRYGIIEKFDLVCGQGYVVGLILSLMAVGQTASSLIGTVLIDNLGRKLTLFLSLTWYILCNIVIIFMPNWPSFCAIIFLRSLAGSVNFQVVWVYALELAPPSKHALVTFCMMATWAVFAMILAGIAWLCSTWVQLLSAATFPILMFYVAFPFMDESPRWLMATHRFEQVKTVLEKIAVANDIKIDVNELHVLIDEEAEIAKNSRSVQKEERKGGRIKGLWSLFATKDLALKTLSIMFIWSVDNVVYEGMMIMVGDIGSNHYVTFTLLAAVEVLSDLTIYITADRIGRISPMALSTVAAGVVCLTTGLVKRNNHAVLVTLAVIAKYFSTLSFDVIFLVGGEIFPTVIRGAGVAFCAAMAALAYVPIPFIVVASKNMPYIPLSIFGALSVAAGIIAIFLPETAHRHMLDQVSQTMEQPMGFQAFKENVTCQSLRQRRKERDTHRIAAAAAHTVTTTV